MEENKHIKISLKTAIIIACIIIILIIGLIVILSNYTKKEQPINTDSRMDGSNQESSSGDYIYNKEIQSIVIKYYEGYNIATGDGISETIPLNTINLKSNELNEVSKLIKTLTKVKYSKNDEMYNHMQYDHICDNYKLEINNNFIIYIGDEYGITAEKNDYFKVPEELYSKILEIVKTYNEDNVYKTINSEKITIICKQEKLEVTDTEQLKGLSNHQYYVINASDKDFDNEEVAYTLDLNDGRKIDIYFASVLSCIYYENGTHEYIYTGNLENFVKKIFENSRVKINTNIVNEIKVTYKNKEYIIDNQNKIEELLREFKNLQYNYNNYLNSMSESDFDDNDIKIFVNNSKYIIPGDSGYGSRFYVDADGKLYDVSGLYNNNLEKYFKELVDYDK